MFRTPSHRKYCAASTLKGATCRQSWRTLSTATPVATDAVIDPEMLCRSLAMPDPLPPVPFEPALPPDPALLDPSSPKIQHYRRGRFVPYTPENSDLPIVQSSVDWYRGWRDHLGYASVIPDGSIDDASSSGATLQEARA